MRFQCVKDGLIFAGRSWKKGETLDSPEEPCCGRGTSLVEPEKGKPAFALIDDNEGPEPVMEAKPAGYVAPVDKRSAEEIRQNLERLGHPMPDRTGRKKLLEKEKELLALNGKDAMLTPA